MRGRAERYPMGMKASALAALLASILFAPALAVADAAIDEARGAQDNPQAYDGASDRPGSDAVVAEGPDGPGDRRRRERQLRRSDARRAQASPVPHGEDKEIEPRKSNGWFAENHAIAGVSGAFIGALIGSLWGWPGAGIGLVLGALIFYSVSRLKA